MGDLTIRSKRGKIKIHVPPPSPPPPGNAFYIAPNAGTGSGTIGDPFGLDDLQTFNGTYYTPGTAFAGLTGSDKLYFREGSYHLTGVDRPHPNASSLPMIGPSGAITGSSGSPITIRNYPGEAVNLIVDGDTAQSVFATDAGNDYIRVLGLTITLNPVTGGSSGGAMAFRMGGSRNEFAYNDVIGATWTDDTGDNCEGIAIISQGGPVCDQNWVHHNKIHGVNNSSGAGGANCTGIKLYYGGLATIEDNYVYGCRSASYDKGATLGVVPDFYHHTIYRRNLFVDNITYGLVGDGQEEQGTWEVYDNVMDNTPYFLYSLHQPKFYNNLLLSLDIPNSYDLSHGKVFARVDGSLPGPTQHPLQQIMLWNNVVFPPTAAVTAFQTYLGDFVVLSDPDAILAFMNNNVYGGTPTYDWGNYNIGGGLLTSKTLAQAQAAGIDTNASVVSGPLDVYEDTASYVLKTSPTNWTVAGVASPTDSTPVCVGPGRSTPSVNPAGVITVAQIRDTTRYGPGAIGSYT